MASRAIAVMRPAATEVRRNDERKRLVRAEAEARLRRTARWLEFGVVGAWFGCASALASLLGSIFDYGGLLGVAVVAMSIGGILAPIAVAGQRRIKSQLSDRRFRLEAAFEGDVEHLSPSLRALALETRMVVSAVDRHADGVGLCRTVWDWLRQVEDLDEPARETLGALGLSVQPVRDLIFRGARGRAALRAGLTDSQQIQLSHHLERFESTLTHARTRVYR